MDDATCCMGIEPELTDPYDFCPGCGRRWAWRVIATFDDEVALDVVLDGNPLDDKHVSCRVALTVDQALALAAALAETAGRITASRSGAP